MIQINGKLIDADYHIVKEYKGGRKLIIELSTSNSNLAYFTYESKLECDNNCYLVKSIDEQDEVTTIECTLDLNSLKSNIYNSFISDSWTLEYTLKSVLLGTGWVVKDADLVSIRRSLNLTDVTPYDIIGECQETYGVVYEINAKEKSIIVKKPENKVWNGIYITDQLNLRQVDRKGSSYGLITRLYAYGAVNEETGDALSFASINDGKEYIDNNQCSNEIISAVWRDERYTDAQSLKDATIEQLNVLSKPSESYELDIIDLAKINNDYSVLAMDLYDKVMLINRKSKTKIEHQIVEYVEYPNNPEKNVITLSTVIQPIEVSITKQINTIHIEQTVAKKKINEMKNDIDTNTARIAETYTIGETDYLVQSQITQSKEEIRFDITKSESIINDKIDELKNSPVEKVVNTTVVIDEAGVTVGKTNSECETTLSEDGVQITSRDTAIATFNSHGVKTKNLYVQNEVEFGNLRIMKVIENGQNRCHIHFTG